MISSTMIADVIVPMAQSRTLSSFGINAKMGGGASPIVRTSGRGGHSVCLLAQTPVRFARR
jgi:hypothetical protein